MELHRFKELKDKGGASLQRLGPKTYQIVAKRYDGSTGEEQQPEIVPVNVDGVVAAIKQLDDQIKSLQDSREGLLHLKTEVDALELPLPIPKAVK